jgi:methyl-accepting chemotaxis protein
MLIYFGFIAAASILITVEFVWAVRVIITQTQPILQTGAPDGIENVLASLRSLQNKAFLIGVVQALFTLIVLIMLIRRITDPLRKMIEKARRISEGDLSPTILVHRRDEIGLLAETINGLTSNIQEIVAFGLSAEASLQVSLKALRPCLQHDALACEQLDKIAHTLSGFGNLLDGFQLLPAPPAGTEAQCHGK